MNVFRLTVAAERRITTSVSRLIGASRARSGAAKPPPKRRKDTGCCRGTRHQMRPATTRPGTAIPSVPGSSNLSTSAVATSGPMAPPRIPPTLNTDVAVPRRAPLCWLAKR